MQRRIVIGNVTYICNLSHDDEKEYWSCANAKLVAEYLKNNGYSVVAINDDGCPQSVEVRSNLRYFNQKAYTLNQCEDLLEWLRDSYIGEFTIFYDKVLFNTEDGFIAAYRDDINNFWKF